LPFLWNSIGLLLQDRLKKIGLTVQNVEAQYDPSKERIQEQNYQTELKIKEFLQRENIEKKMISRFEPPPTNK
jgi:hypothetical protein